MKVSRNVILLSITSLLNDISSEMIIPILPLFITSLGGTGIEVGILAGMLPFVANTLKVVFGYVSDLVKKRLPFVFTGYLTSALFKLLLALSKTPLYAITFASLERMGKGIRTAPRDALIAESMPKRSGLAFGFHRAFDTVGAIIGSVLAFILIASFPLNTIIFIAAMISFISLSALFFVREPKPRTKVQFRWSKIPKRLKRFYFIISLFYIGNIGYMFFVLQASTVNKSFALLLYILFNIIYASFSIPFGLLSDKIGKNKVILFSFITFSLACFSMTFINIISLIAGFVLFGLFKAMLIPSQRAYISDLAKINKATYLGIFYTVVGIAQLFAGVFAGILYTIAPSLPFIYGALLSLLSATIFVFMKI